MADENFNLSQDLLNELLEYRDGELFWKVSRPHVKKGQLAGRISDKGYYSFKVYVYWEKRETKLFELLMPIFEYFIYQRVIAFR